MTCRRCGECCEYIVLSIDKEKDWPSEKEWLLAHVGVSVESEDGQEATLRFDLSCRHLVPSKDGSPAGCLVHDRKPRVCVEYPDDENREYLEKRPWLTPNCGYLRRGSSGGGGAKEK